MTRQMDLCLLYFAVYFSVSREREWDGVMVPWGVMLEQEEALAVFRFFRCPRGICCWTVVMETLLFGGVQDWLQTKVKGKKTTRGIVCIAGAKQNLQMSEPAVTPPRCVGCRYVRARNQCGSWLGTWCLALGHLKSCSSSCLQFLFSHTVEVLLPKALRGAEAICAGCWLFFTPFCCWSNSPRSMQVLLAPCANSSEVFTVIRKRRKAILQALLSVKSKENCIIPIKLCPALKFRGSGCVC